MSPEINTFACEICAEQKKATNRWWILWVGVRKQLKIAEFSKHFWARLKQTAAHRAVACGEEHAMQLAARWMVSGSFDSPSSRPVSPSPASPPLPLRDGERSRTVPEQEKQDD